MKPMSGKIDRRCLPRLADLPAAAGTETQNQHSDTVDNSSTIPNLDADIAPGNEEVLAICRAVFESELGWDDAFVNHGGHSIIIAQLAQCLQAAGWSMSVRALTTTVKTNQNRIKRDEAAAHVLSVGFFTTLQVLFLALLYSPALIGFLGLIALSEIGEFFMTASLWEFIVVGFVTYLFALAVPFASLLWVMLIKLFMGGHIYRNNVTPGVYPKWSRMHLRTWCIGRLESSVLRTLNVLYRSAPLMAYVLRRLGANVGDNLQCANGVEFSGPLDLLSIEDDVAIQTGAHIRMSRWSGQELHIGPVHLESGCKIGMRAAIANDVTVGRGSWITPFTPILNNVGPEEIWEGAPASFSGRCTALKRTAYSCHNTYPRWFLETLNIVMQTFLDFFLIVVPTAVVTWFAASFMPAREAEVTGEYFMITPLHEIIWQIGLYAFITTWFTIVLISILASLFLRYTATSPGLYSSHGLKGALLMYRIKTMNRIQHQWTWTITGQYLRALAGVRFPRLGASECDLMFNIVPELVSADSQVFWSNGCFSNMLDYGAEHIKLCRLDMPRNFFSGNNCVAESGQFPSNFLLGVSTPGNDIRFRRQMRSRLGEPITVAGNPPVKFASAHFEAENEAQRRPTLLLFLARVFLNDILSIGILPIATILVYVILYTSLLRMELHLLISAFIALILADLILVVSCTVIKKILVGNQWGSAHSTPFWSWRHFSYFFAQDCFFAWCRTSLRMSSGTVLSNIILRGMGCRIGKRTIISSPMQASDWNAVSFGNDCMVNGFLQFHTFENMLLKVKRTEIKDGSAINFGATVMGGALIEPGTTLLPLSLTLKEMYLPTAIYEGSPAEPVGSVPPIRSGQPAKGIHVRDE
jgi:non-ribosomal peptide synthetase-like protein